MGFRWAVTALCTCFVAGAYVDAWSRESVAHPLGPWQDGLLEAGWLGVTALVGPMFIRNLMRGTPWRDALPDGLHICLLGCAIFAAAAVLDGLYQQAFGVEAGHEALYAPTHLLELVGGGLMVSASFTNGLSKPGRRAPWHVVLSAALTLSSATFFTLGLNPLIDPLAAGTGQQPWEWKSLGMAEIVVHVTLLSAIVALLIRNFTAPAGGLSLVFVLNGLLVALVKPHFELLPVLVVTGVVADGAHLVARRLVRDARAQSMPIGGFIGCTYVLAYWAAVVFVEGGTWWSTGLWLGNVMAAALTGAIACYVVGVLPSRGAGAPDAGGGIAHAWPVIAAKPLKRTLEALQDREELAATPLARALSINGSAEVVAAELRQHLMAGIERLGASDQFRTAQAGRLLRYYYVQRIGSQEVVAERLHISRPTFYRRLQDGLEQLAQQLATPWEAAETSHDTVETKDEIV